MTTSAEPSRGLDVRRSIAICLAATGVLLLLFGLRATPVARWDDRAEKSIGGSDSAFAAISGCLRVLPMLAVAVSVVVVVALGWPRLRRPAAQALVVLAGSNLTVLLVKRLCLCFLDAGSATLPSGHATLALSAAVALVFLAQVYREFALGCAAFVAVFGVLGVVAGYWHKPGDAVASCAVVTGWVALTNLHRSRARHARRAPRLPGASAATSLGMGGVTACVLLLGWGSAPQHSSFTRFFVGALCFVLLTVMPAGVLLLAARVAEGPSRRTH